MTHEPIPEFPPHVSTHHIYISCLLLFLLTAALLPWVEIDVSVNSPALIRPSAEVNIIRSLTSGRVKESYLSENKKVRKGDVLFVLESEDLLEQEKYVLESITIHRNEIRDLNTLISNARLMKPDKLPAFNNSLYQQKLSDYHQKISEAENHLNKARKEYERQHRLFNEKVIPAAEFETYQFELQRMDDAIHQIRETHLTQWQNDIKNVTEKFKEMELKMNQINKEKASLTIRSPLNGTLQNITGIYPNSLVFSNQEIGMISPDTSLIAIALVSPNDIGLIQKEMSVRITVEAFNYNQWGVLSGSVVEIPWDIKIIDTKPVFEVRCSLHQDFLQLKNGCRGFLKKGMTTQARFLVARRSLWQLLYDKVDDWINPNTFNKQGAALP